MITYKEIATPADKQFQARCRRELGVKHYLRLVPIARLAFQEGMKDPNPNKRHNTARRMANMVFTNALNKIKVRLNASS